MPLLPGKKHIGDNIKTEEEHGKPPDQAKAIALRVAGVPPKTSKHSERKGVSSRLMKGSIRVTRTLGHSKSASGNPVRQDRPDASAGI